MQVEYSKPETAARARFFSISGRNVNERARQAPYLGQGIVAQGPRYAFVPAIENTVKSGF